MKNNQREGEKNYLNDGIDCKKFERMKEREREEK